MQQMAKWYGPPKAAPPAMLRRSLSMFVYCTFRFYMHPPLHPNPPPAPTSQSKLLSLIQSPLPLSSLTQTDIVKSCSNPSILQAKPQPRRRLADSSLSVVLICCIWRKFTTGGLRVPSGPNSGSSSVSRTRELTCNAGADNGQS